MLVEQLGQPLEPRLARHDDVHQDQVGIPRACLEDRVPDGAGLADRLHVDLGVDQQAQTRANDRMVVDDEDANHPAGTSTATVVPAPLRDSICSEPPSSSTRSRIP